MVFNVECMVASLASYGLHAPRGKHASSRLHCSSLHRPNRSGRGLIVACTTTSRTRLTNLRAKFSRESFRGILHLVKSRNGLYRIARMKTSYPPCEYWLRDRQHRLVSMTCLFSQRRVVFPTRRTHERLHPCRGLLAVAGCMFHCGVYFVYQLPRDLTHHLRLRFFSDSYCELQDVPVVLFDSVASGAGSKELTCPISGDLFYPNRC